MADKKPLHVIVTPGHGQILNKEIGWLSLSKAGEVKISIREYRERRSEMEKKQTEKLEIARKNYNSEIADITAEQENSFKFISQNTKNYNEGKVSKETYNANVAKREESIKARKIKIAEIETIYKKEVDELNSNYETALKLLDEEYQTVRWVWQLVGDKRPRLNKESFNEAIVMGKPELTLNFSDFLEGGGATFIEPFWDGESPTGSNPFGLIINAKGEKSEIISADWRDADDNKITTAVKFGSTVYLNIYTAGLYGHNLKIQLLDKDNVIRILSLGLTHADDKLFAYQYLDNNTDVEKRTVRDIDEKEFQFTRAVSVVSAKHFPENAKSGLLIKEDNDAYDGKVKAATSIQKCKFPVFIDPMWKIIEGDNLEIYPEVEQGKIENGKKSLSNSILKVSDEKGKMIGQNISTSNQVAVLSEIETDMAYFSPCRFTTIKLSEKDKAPLTLFDSEDIHVRQSNPIKIDVITGEKKVYFIDIDFDTVECEKKPVQHTDKEFTLTEIPANYTAELVSGGAIDNKVLIEKKYYESSSTSKTQTSGTSSTNKEQPVNLQDGKVTIRQNQIEFDAFFKYNIPDNSEASSLTIFNAALKYFWLPDLGDKIKHIKLRAATCAFDKSIDIGIYPDIKWTLKFGFNVTKEDVEALNKRGLKTPLGVFEALDNEVKASQKIEDDKNLKFLDENNELKKIKNKELNETRKEFKLKKKTKKSKKEITPVTKGKLTGLINILKKLNISLAEEHYGGNQKNELNEEFVKQFYNRYQETFELVLQAVEIIEGSKDPSGDNLEDFLKSKSNKEKGKSVDGLRDKLNRKPVEYDILYPKLALAGSWFYELVDPKKFPKLAGRQGLTLDINISAKPLIGVSVTWDLLELLCRKHPVAYVVLKAIDAVIYALADDESAVTCNFKVTGQIDTEIDWQYNMLAGFKDLYATGKQSLKVEIEFKINIANTYKMLKYEVIIKRGFSVGASSGIGITDKFGVDSQGLYNQKILEFEGIKFEFSATGIIQIKEGNSGEKRGEDPLLDLGGKIKGEITFLNYKYETPRFYLNS